jgi:GT2 family glycosyltransferase
MKSIGIVVIGRNEGERLRRCLAAALRQSQNVVYVDSASVDESVKTATALGADVVELDERRPLSAARARNVGFRRLVNSVPDVAFVQFVDGDCELSEGWCEAGAAELERREDAAIVCGRLRERHPEASIYNRLCDIEWEGPCGDVPECGGIFIARRSAFAQVGGFEESLIAGEDPDLCVRLRSAGWKIVRLPREMALHDAAMRRFGQWWRRAVRGGHSCAAGAWRHAREGDLLDARRTFSILVWGLALPALVIGLAWPSDGWSLLLLASFPVQWWRMWRRELEARSPREASLTATFTILAKFAGLLGLGRYVWERIVQRPARLIEYK